jgi:hypothetical protein
MVYVSSVTPERMTFEPIAYRSSASIPDAVTVVPSTFQSEPILDHSKRGEAGTDDEGVDGPLADIVASGGDRRGGPSQGEWKLLANRSRDRPQKRRLRAMCQIVEPDTV